MNKHYGSINGLRALAAIGIMAMHVYTNANYHIEGYIFNTIIPSFTDFVFLFFVISSFVMSCGYYDKVNNRELKLSEFYKRRFIKTLPFFGLLVLIDLLVSPSRDSLVEAFLDVSLLFGFLPGAGNISVIGVGWFIGVLFVYYICFPFFCCIIQKKSTAWFAFAVSVGLNYACTYYFKVGRTNILYCACFLLAGGLCFLYKDNIEKTNKWIIFVFLFVGVICYYVIGPNTITRLLVSILLLWFAINSTTYALDNPITRWLSSISLEIYLSHMMMYRVVEKTKIFIINTTDWKQYLLILGVVFIGTLLFSFFAKWIIQRIENVIINKQRKKIN